MLTAEVNEKLTRVGAGTPMGTLMRYYWHPIAAVSELDKKPVKPIRLLGEDLVLFRDGQGRLGLVGDRCAHRLVKLEFGYPVEEGLRCPYHAWTYDSTGQCVAQPCERPDSTFKDKIKIKAYPVQQLAGMIFAYLGEQPAPLLPRWEPMVREDLTHEIYYSHVACNWLQGMENSPDQTHVEWLHGHFAKYKLLEKGYAPDSYNVRFTGPFMIPHLEIATEPFEHGLLRRRLRQGGTKDDEAWRVGQPVMMPNMNMITQGGSMTIIWRTAVDDTHCIQWDMQCFSRPDGEADDVVPCYEIKLQDAEGRWNVEQVRVQDHLACIAQGDIMDRTQEHLAESDTGIIHYRQMLQKQLAMVEDGQEPMNVFRDPIKNVCIKLPVIEGMGQRRAAGLAGTRSPWEWPEQGLVRVG